MFSIGMHVKFDIENADGELKTILGQMEKEYKEDAIILCYERNGGRLVVKKMRVRLDNLFHARIAAGSICNVGNRKGIIVDRSRKTNDTELWSYHIKFFDTGSVRLVCEDRIIADQSAVSNTAVDILRRGEISDFESWEARENIYNYNNNAALITEGFNTAIGSKIEMYEHQLETVERIVSNKPYRAMLADEVGLGKSIESLVVLSYAIAKGLVNRALIIVPNQLVQQWRLEACSKFALDAQTFVFHTYVIDRKISQVLIIGFDDYKKYCADYFNYSNWDFVIVDEAHKVLRDRSLYLDVLNLSRETENFLMLSATPILQREEEYFNLLKILYPEHYIKLGIKAFNSLMKKRNEIIEDVSYLNDNLKYFKEYELSEDYISRLESINEVIDDAFIEDVVYRMRKGKEDKYSLAFVAVKFLCASYEIDSKFIRHRRMSILDPSSKRVLDSTKEIRSKNYNSGLRERDIKNYVIDEIDDALLNNMIKPEEAIKVCNAVFSSIGALQAVIRNSGLDKMFKSSILMINNGADLENQLLENSRLDCLVDTINDLGEKAGKIIVFSDFLETAYLIEKRLVREYGKERISRFTNDLSPAGMQIAANKFQHEKECQILICDKSGGEGRNFQFAEYLIHFDMPWSPADIEQRIGRLDRIGRKPKHLVKNIVLYEADTIEQDIFELFNKTLNVFEESLCGIEIIFEDMNKIIHDHVLKGIKIGIDDLEKPLADLKEVTENQLSNESLSIMLQQASADYHNLEKEMVSHFNEEETMKFQNALAKWIDIRKMGTCDIAEKPYRKVKIILDKAYSQKRMAAEGTFFVSDALQYEDIALLSCENRVVNTISYDAVRGTYGRVASVGVKKAGINWRGFVLTWNLDLNVADYFKGEFDTALLTLENEFILKDRISMTYSLNGSKDKDISDILQRIADGIRNNNAYSLTYKEIEEALDYSDLEMDLKNAINESRSDYLNSQSSLFAYDNLNKRIDNIRFTCQLNDKINNKNTYEEEKLRLYVALKEAMDNVSGRLDSVLFVKLDK